MNINWRHWHAWLSVILSMPLFIVGMTAILIAHHKALGLKELPFAADWLSANQTLVAAELEVKAGLVTATGQWYLGTKNGLLMLQDGALQAVPALTGQEIRSLSANGPLLVAAGNRGAWLLQDGVWRQINRRPAHQVQLAVDGAIYLATLDNGLLFSRDWGATWAPLPHIEAALRAAPPMPPESYDFNKLVMDLHTGKAIFGKHWEWLWIDSLGLLMLFLSMSGVYLWWQGQKRHSNLAANSR